MDNRFGVAAVIEKQEDPLRARSWLKDLFAALPGGRESV